MKALLTLLLTVIFLSSCDKQQESGVLDHATAEQIATDSVEAYLYRSLNDPDSYKSVSTQLIRYTVQDTLRTRVLFMETNADLDFIVPKDSLPAHKAKIEELQKQISRLDTVGNETLSYTVLHKFRGKNAFGALILNDYEFTLDKDFNIIGAKQLKE